MRARLTVAALLAATVLAGCGDASGTEGGGAIVGETLTVYSLLPLTGERAEAAADVVDGQKLALMQAGGQVGAFKVNFVSLDIGDPEVLPDRVREALRDTQTIAVIGDLDSETARVTVPLVNAAGILHVSPGATYPGFVAAVPGGPADEPDRWRPSGRATFAPVPPTDAAQAVAIADAARGTVAVEAEAGDAPEALARAVRSRLRGRLTDDPRRADTVVYAGESAENAVGVVEAVAAEAPRARILLPESLLRTDLHDRLDAGLRRRVRYLASTAPPAEQRAVFEERFGGCPGPYAAVGHRAMRSVLETLRAAGDDANDRDAVARVHLRGDPLSAAARDPWYLATGPGCDDRYEPVD